MPKRPDLPDLAPTGRRYLDDTLRARLQSPGIERFVSKGGGQGRAGRLALAAVLAVALVAAMVFFAR
jgi:hypothetical protein